MPEGHTIHRLARDHKSLLLGQRARVSSPQGRFAAGAARLDGRTVARVEPYGKHLWYHADGGELLHVHLGLYGKWRSGVLPAPEPVGALRVRFLTAEHWLDLRGPTACELHTPAERAGILARLGPDPLRKDADPGRVWDRVARTKRTMGELLMDQSVLAGIGNVYRAEVLFRAGLSPFRSGQQLREETWLAMWDDIRALMRAGVRANRIVTTFPMDRARVSGRPTSEDAHYVYRRAGQPCRRCGTAIRTEVMAGRNLFWCSTCQPA